MSPFQLNMSYTRAEIHAVLGGSVQAFLPTVAGVVVAGCFRRDMNPDAPAVVLPGNGPVIKSAAESFAESRRAVPVFVKQNIGDWRFVGTWGVSQLSRDPAEITNQANRAGRTDVSCVLHLTEVKQPDVSQAREPDGPSCHGPCLRTARARPSCRSAQNMKLAIIQFADEVYGCRACSGFCFESPNPETGYFKFPPSIGALHQVPLLFVGINPRISPSNRSLHDWLMADRRAFEALAGNRVDLRRYIAAAGLERHYRAHVAVVDGLFLEKAFEDVAAVTELFLCAKKNAGGLPIQKSPCAQRFLHRTASLIKPQVILPVGRQVHKYFQTRSGKLDDVFESEFLGTPSWVVPMSHPAAHPRHRTWEPEWTIKKVKEVLGDT